MKEKNVWSAPRLISYGAVVSQTNEPKVVGGADGVVLCGIGEIGYCSK